MNGLLIESYSRQLAHLEGAKREAPPNQVVVACGQCFILLAAVYDQAGRLIVDKEPHMGQGHDPVVWDVDQVITKLRQYIDALTIQ